MILSRLSANLKGPWMIDPMSAETMLPVLRSVLHGLNVSMEAPETVSEKLPMAKGASSSGGGQKKIHILHLEGTMMRYDYCGSPGSKSLAAMLRKADKEEDVLGHIIVADSGGGNAASVHDLSEAILSCNKPVVGFVDGTAASACIYALSYCSSIIAHQPMNMIGCVGTMIELSGYAKFRRGEDGTLYARIYADQAGEKNLDYEAALEGNASILKENLLNPLCQQFIDDMKTNRPGCTDEQLHGKTYFAKDVVGSFIDSIGTLEDAMGAVIRQAQALDESKHITDMSIYKNLAAIAALAGLAIAEDGSATLSEEQLKAVNDALGSAQEAAESNSDEATSLRSTLAQRDLRISELETSLEAAIARANNEKPEVPVGSTPSSANEPKGAQTHEEAVAACRAFMNKYKNI